MGREGVAWRGKVIRSRRVLIIALSPYRPIALSPSQSTGPVYTDPYPYGLQITDRQIEAVTRKVEFCREYVRSPYSVGLAGGNSHPPQNGVQAKNLPTSLK